MSTDSPLCRMVEQANLSASPGKQTNLSDPRTTSFTVTRVNEVSEGNLDQLLLEVEQNGDYEGGSGTDLSDISATGSTIGQSLGAEAQLESVSVSPIQNSNHLNMETVALETEAGPFSYLVADTEELIRSCILVAGHNFVRGICPESIYTDANSSVGSAIKKDANVLWPQGPEGMSAQGAGSYPSILGCCRRRTDGGTTLSMCELCHELIAAGF